MSNPVWPVSLPQTPPWNGYSESPPDTVLRTQMDAGPAKTRQRFTAGVRPIQERIRMSWDQVATLDTFYVTTLSNGALKFDWVHPRTAAVSVYRFTAAPSWRPSSRGKAWDVTMQLEIMP